jgi:hypothetical protein
LGKRRYDPSSAKIICGLSWAEERIRSIMDRREDAVYHGQKRGCGLSWTEERMRSIMGRREILRILDRNNTTDIEPKGGARLFSSS